MKRLKGRMAMQATERARTSIPVQGGATGVFSPAEAADLFDATARTYLGISGTEFLRIWDAHEFAPDAEWRARAMRVATLIPLVRKPDAGKKAR